MACVSGRLSRSRLVYDYEADGARKLVNCPERPCRVHSYGDSFTHCDQVSDGETWQECLAAHLREPIRNYGVGGYSVYQAYRRMRAVERFCADNGIKLLVMLSYGVSVRATASGPPRTRCAARPWTPAVRSGKR